MPKGMRRRRRKSHAQSKEGLNKPISNSEAIRRVENKNTVYPT